jgi:proteic killer suppression protein
MIQTFANKETAAVFLRLQVRRFSSILVQAQRKLALLNQATTVEELRIPPGNRLERLSGDRAGQWSIRINDQWRVCFRFEDGDAFEVEIVDYH